MLSVTPVRYSKVLGFESHMQQGISIGCMLLLACSFLTLHLLALCPQFHSPPRDRDTRCIVFTVQPDTASTLLNALCCVTGDVGEACVDQRDHAPGR